MSVSRSHYLPFVLISFSPLSSHLSPYATAVSSPTSRNMTKHHVHLKMLKAVAPSCPPTWHQARLCSLILTVINHVKLINVVSPHREMRTDTFSSITKRPKGSESPNSYLDHESRRRCTVPDYDKLAVGCPIEANVVQPRMREHKPSRGQYFSSRAGGGGF